LPANSPLYATQEEKLERKLRVRSNNEVLRSLTLARGWQKRGEILRKNDSG